MRKAGRKGGRVRGERGFFHSTVSSFKSYRELIFIERCLLRVEIPIEREVILPEKSSCVGIFIEEL